MKILRIAIIVILAAGLLLGAVLPILAAPEVAAEQGVAVQLDRGPRSPWGWVKEKLQRNRLVQGVVATVATDRITLEGDKVIYVNSETKYRVPGLGRDAILSDIKQGMRIVALVYEQDGKTYARQISTVPGVPEYKHRVGEVTAYTAGSSITIESKDGALTTFKIAADFKILPKNAIVEIGKQVTIISRREPSNTEFVATGIVVHPAAKQDGNGVYLRRILEAIKNMKNVSGNIVSISDTAIIIDPTPGGATGDDVILTRDAQTLIVLRGVNGLAVGQSAIVFYTETGSTKLAKIVVVGIGLAELSAESET
jgi:hypothetical protein